MPDGTSIPPDIREAQPLSRVEHAAQALHALTETIENHPQKNIAVETDPVGKTLEAHIITIAARNLHPANEDPKYSTYPPPLEEIPLANRVSTSLETRVIELNDNAAATIRRMGGLQGDEKLHRAYYDFRENLGKLRPEDAISAVLSRAAELQNPTAAESTEPQPETPHLDNPLSRVAYALRSAVKPGDENLYVERVIQNLEGFREAFASEIAPIVDNNPTPEQVAGWVKDRKRFRVDNIGNNPGLIEVELSPAQPVKTSDSTFQPSVEYTERVLRELGARESFTDLQNLPSSYEAMHESSGPYLKKGVGGLPDTAVRVRTSEPTVFLKVGLNPQSPRVTAQLHPSALMPKRP